jgi:leucyl-tRNA synthetase
MLGQMKRLGFSFDYDRVFYSSDEGQYRWSQWLFITLLEHDLIYRADTTVDWCDTCQTTLASIQVEDGRCWRCHNEVRLIRRPTWFLRITPYLEENDRNNDKLAQGGRWDQLSLATQRYILGRSEGVELDLQGEGRSLTVFTPHRKFAAHASFVLLSPRHPDVDAWIADDSVREELEKMRSGGWERSARDARSVPLVDTGLSIPGPGGEELPVAVTPLVDARFGPAAALGIPAIDEADRDLAERLERVEAPPAPEEGEGPAPAPVEGARETTRYRANDFSISRQRSWGTPIPVILCDECGPQPVPDEDLPVVLPRDIKPTGEGNPLAERPDFVDVECPKCGGAAKRETDTLDCHFDALWLWVPAAVPPEDREEQMFTHPDLQKWLPSERLVADHGAATVRLAVLYAAGPAKPLNWSDGAVRFAARFLRNLWNYTHERAAAFEGLAHDPEAAADTEHMRDRLRKWCENGLARITDDTAELQMHKSVRNITRLFERIQDFEKRVVKRRGQLDRADAEAQLAALALLARTLIPFAPHAAEELLVALGVEDNAAALEIWPVEAEVPVHPARLSKTP